MILATVFFSYSHADEILRDQLEVHLAMLKNQGLIEAWHDRRIKAGDEFDREISAELERAEVILLLVSPDLLASKYCYEIELKRAMEHHDAGTARVIPVILRHCDWRHAPFGKLLAAPKDGKPIKAWPDIDAAFLDVVSMICDALPQKEPVANVTKASDLVVTPNIGPRSSNLRLRKEFTDLDREKFLRESFEFIANFFDNSLSELKERNRGVQTEFRRIDALLFSTVIYRNGKAVSRCKILLGGMFSNGISFSYNDNADDGSINESLSVNCDDQTLYLRPLGTGAYGRVEKHLSQEGASEYFWSLLVEPLQH